MFKVNYFLIIVFLSIFFVSAEEDDPCGGKIHKYKSKKSYGDIKKILSKTQQDSLIWLDFSKTGEDAIKGSLKPKVEYEGGVEQKKNYLEGDGEEGSYSYFDNITVGDLISEDKLDLALFVVFDRTKDGEKSSYNNVSLFGEHGGGYFNLMGLNEDNILGGGIWWNKGSKFTTFELADISIPKNEKIVAVVYLNGDKVTLKVGGKYEVSEELYDGAISSSLFEQKIGLMKGRKADSTWGGKLYELIAIPFSKVKKENLNDVLAALQKKWDDIK